MNNFTTVTILGIILFSFFCACNHADKDKTPVATQHLNNTGNQAIDAVTAKIKGSPNDPELYYSRAELFYENEGYDEAIQDLNRALGLDSTNVTYFHLLADVYLDYYQSRAALETLEKVVSLYPERIPSLLKLSEFQLILQQYEASMQTIDQILRIDPQNSEAYFMFGMNFKETGDTARAINSFQRATELNPEIIDAWINLGQLHAALGNSIASRYFDTALSIAPGHIEALHAKADYLTAQDQLTDALAVYRQINQMAPQYEEAYYNAGLLYMELDSVDQAYQQFNIVIETFPLHIRAYFYRGLAAEYLGKTEQARADYQQALKLAPDYQLPQDRLRALEAIN